jgi:subtilisin family serine protease
MKIFNKTAIILFFISFILSAQTNIIHKGNKYYFANRIIVKYKNQNTVHLQKAKSTTLKQFGITNIYNTFKIKENSDRQAQELNKIYTLEFNSPFNPVYLVKKIKELPEVEWAEPFYLYELSTEPNDPKFLDSTQTNLLQISAEQAWDINTGSDSIIIAIVDTGIDWDHPDLENNIWINKNEIADNGVDDDNNGYIDDIRGWDFGGLDGTSDNDPNEDKADHGTHVAGISSAVTNNNIGIASIGYNCKLMAVKTSQNNVRSDNGSALIAYGYQGIIYAADNGAKVINCSWGGYGYSIANQEAINYAISKGALIVAAAGNDNKSETFYPASYKGVLSVASVNSSDVRSSFSNYSNSVDVSAPGEQIYSTWYNNSYTSLTGTSMASPLTAGLAALVTNEFPNYTPLQIAEQIRVNTDNIDNLNSNYKYRIGTGRINAFKSLNNKNSKSVRILSYNIYDSNDEIFESGDELTIEINFINYLSPTTNLSISLLPQTSNISLVNGNFTAGSTATLESFNNSSNKFKIKISDNAPSNVTENILVQYSDGTYTDFEWITVDINPAYRTQKSGNLNLTVTSKGSLGFDDFPNNSKGEGLTFKESKNLLFEGALMYGTSLKTIVNSARNATSGSSDNDFFTTTPFTLKIPGNLADEQGLTIFNDNNAGTGTLKIETKLQTYSYSNTPNDNYIILEYSFYNTTSSSIDNFYVGIYSDFDIGTGSDNDFANYNSENNFGYVYDNEENPNNPIIGIALLNHENYGFFAMDIDGTNDSVSSYSGFSDLEKWKTLSSGITYKSSGPSDISAVTSAGPFSIVPQSKIIVSFCFAGGDSLSEVSEAIKQSRIKYLAITTVKDNNPKIPNSFNLYQNYPNPFNPTTTIKYSITTPTQLNLSQGKRESEGVFVSLRVYNILGKEVAILVNKKQKPGSYKIQFDASKLSSGIYFYKLQSGNYIETKKMIMIK